MQIGIEDWWENKEVLNMIESVWVRERERECMCVCVWVRERES